jgi:thiamine-phosphate pyrophosphorylase
MHQMSPAAERAVAGARNWAKELGAETVGLAHFLLALLDEEEGRPSVLIERVGESPTAIRARLRELLDSPAAPADEVLFALARNWSLSHRHDPEFLTDALLLAVIRADRAFERICADIGLDAARLEAALVECREPEPRASEPPADHGHPAEASAGDAARILDANLNRAREAARVVEDYCRFVLNDRLLTEEVKSIRHDLGEAASLMPVLAARDTPGDVGSDVAGANEYQRASAAHVAAANLKRLQESLRSLEEYGKLVGAEVGRRIEALRYRAYTLEGAVLGRERWRKRLDQATLYVIVGGSNRMHSLEDIIAGAAAGGAAIIQLREKGLTDRELLARARDVRRWTRASGVLFIVNDRPDIARLADADGVHIGQDDLSVGDARRIAGPDIMVGVSTHSILDVQSAVREGADYIGVGPVFPSRTKAFDHFPGLDLVRAASAETSLPLFALGGIGPDNLSRVAAAGATRIAVASAVVESPDVRAAAMELRALLERSGQPAE